jgi:hypothetical protein
VTLPSSSLEFCSNIDGVGVSTASSAGDWCAILADSTPLLRVLTMQSCDLSGTICPSFSRLRSLAVVNLSNNYQGYANDGSAVALSGPIPEFFTGVTPQVFNYRR